MEVVREPKPALRKLNAERIAEEVSKRLPVELIGGWAMPHPSNPEGKCHYFEAPADEATEFITLCGIKDDRAELDVDECDPLAPENCPACRLIVLKRRGLI